MIEQRIGIIDIGSNSIRLVVYERTSSGAHRVIDGSKRSARLSEQIDDNGALPDKIIDELVDTINHFRLICAHHRTGLVRAVATAAIRNATNKQHLLQRVETESGLPIELISGEEEASYGFLGMINSMDVKDGFLIDIGGGSTEVSLFKDRTLVQAVSFPFGCVSLTRRFSSKGAVSDDQLRALEQLVEEAAEREAWLKWSPDLPLIGVGGTIRALGKIHQAHVKYPFESYHNYPMSGSATDDLFDMLRKEPLDKRNKIPGLSKDRIDIIVPGIAILRTIYRIIGASTYVICGAGLRDGLFFSTRFPEKPKLDDVLTYSVNNIAALHPEAPKQHMMQVNRIALQLFDSLELQQLFFPEHARLWIDTASILYRIGASIDYYDYTKHTFYLMINSHINGFSHKEILLCAAIASYKNKNRVRQLAAAYRPMLSEDDVTLICKLGSLLQLAVALDRSETQAIGRLVIENAGGKLELRAIRADGSLAVERKEVDTLAHDFKKLWGLIPALYAPDYR
ncbi:exopolyphosphatase [Paenibacillus baekrokdamisoli]|uniref:Exopolyphosphatase n=1 Tax=Paenibacillus baekrokdamisoli TaxID=1712516 RepID=A0A3G9IRI1_9BACL|nr:Ppx/GppA phosphatase family protein [Paenibacillus baekrokdamisoli]MBB3071060.1 exopolyphosphatase/guanosine-5'-triphosphate,3'-diphosphate pyrophosphatase [Paenibacillus baekrokdamisoli]BBH21477.1 exopolyphosphatase [Paenibacillus baekrokdamisoli]